MEAKKLAICDISDISPAGTREVAYWARCWRPHGDSVDFAVPGLFWACWWLGNEPGHHIAARGQGLRHVGCTLAAAPWISWLPVVCIGTLIESN